MVDALAGRRCWILGPLDPGKIYEAFGRKIVYVYTVPQPTGTVQAEPWQSRLQIFSGLTEIGQNP